VDGLFQGKSDLGNDSPFAPIFPQTNTTVRSGRRTSTRPSAPGRGRLPNGFSTELVALQTQEVPEYAQIVVDAAKAIGVNIKLTVEDGNTYYGEAVYGKSHWLDSVMSLVDYGHRGVPNVFLSRRCCPNGTWNAAHYKNPDYDKMVVDYIAASTCRRSRSWPAGSSRSCSTTRRSSSPTSTTSSRRCAPGHGRPHHGHEPRLGRPGRSPA
jgi:peptide/nickel transport system substrate-binding protein